MERAALADYLEDQSHEIPYSWLGSSTCRFCTRRPIFRMMLGAEERSVDFTDGKYAWPGGLGHYVREHGVRPPAEFVAHVLARRSLSLTVG